MVCYQLKHGQPWVLLVGLLLISSCASTHSNRMSAVDRIAERELTAKTTVAARKETSQTNEPTGHIQLVAGEELLGDLPLPPDVAKPMELPETEEPVVHHPRRVADYVSHYRLAPPDIIRVELINDPSITASEADFGVGIELLVRPDGTIGLSRYGNVHVAGLTVEEAAFAIEDKIQQYLYNIAQPGEDPKAPQVVVDILGFNSTQFYVISDNAGLGASVLEFPFTGSDTTLSALAQAEAAVAGRLALPQNSAKQEIWIVRTDWNGCQQILPVDWYGLTQCGDMSTNYHLANGDVLYINSDKYVRADNQLGKFLSPVNRAFSFVVNGAAAVTSVGTSVITVRKAGIDP